MFGKRIGMKSVDRRSLCAPGLRVNITRCRIDRAVECFDRHRGTMRTTGWNARQIHQRFVYVRWIGVAHVKGGRGEIKGGGRWPGKKNRIREFDFPLAVARSTGLEPVTGSDGRVGCGQLQRRYFAILLLFCHVRITHNYNVWTRPFVIGRGETGNRSSGENPPQVLRVFLAGPVAKCMFDVYVVRHFVLVDVIPSVTVRDGGYADAHVQCTTRFVERGARRNAAVKRPTTNVEATFLAIVFISTFFKFKFWFFSLSRSQRVFRLKLYDLIPNSANS